MLRKAAGLVVLTSFEGKRQRAVGLTVVVLGRTNGIVAEDFFAAAVAVGRVDFLRHQARDLGEQRRLGRCDCGLVVAAWQQQCAGAAVIVQGHAQV